MNAGKRKAIRDKVVAVIGSIAGADVYAFKKVQLETGKPAICVYLEEGDIENPIQRAGVLTIRVMAPDQADIDDVLDGFGDQVQQKIESVPIDHSPDSTDPYRFITEQRYEYDRASAEAWTALDISYRVDY